VRLRLWRLRVSVCYDWFFLQDQRAALLSCNTTRCMMHLRFSFVSSRTGSEDLLLRSI
jgi:hypothetical protein